jgi:hypothetical protein
MENLDRHFTLDRAGNGNGILTPWGKAQVSTEFSPGLLLVETAGHGGFLLSHKFASESLSEAGRKRGEEFNQWLAFEEDSAANIVIYELMDLVAKGYPGLHKERLVSELERDFPGYLEELEGVEAVG